MVATRVSAGPWPTDDFSNLSSQAGRQSGVEHKAPVPQPFLAPDPDLRQGPVLQIPAFMFVLLHLDSCKSSPSDVQVNRRGNDNPS